MSGGSSAEVRVLFRMYEEDCRPTNSFMEFGVTCDADIRRVLDLMHWTDAVDITPGQHMRLSFSKGAQPGCGLFQNVKARYLEVTHDIFHSEYLQKVDQGS